MVPYHTDPTSSTHRLQRNRPPYIVVLDPCRNSCSKSIEQAVMEAPTEATMNENSEEEDHVVIVETEEMRVVSLQQLEDGELALLPPRRFS
eukprot:scaffold2657_cov89-Amphora_coffeaeformis.AAC.6